MREEEKEEERKKYACIPEIAHPLKRVLKKAGVTAIFTSDPKLQNILCGANKTSKDKTRQDKKKKSLSVSVPVFG